MITLKIFHTAFETGAQHVATLTSEKSLEDALADAYEGTQNVESVWVTSKGQHGVRVEPTSHVTFRKVCRSTSVGDYVQVTEEGREDSFWRCCSFGWKPIEQLEQRLLVGMEAQLNARQL